MLSSIDPGPISFDPVDHKYWDNIGELPSVTTILKQVGIIDYKFGNPTAMLRGSLVHRAADMLDRNDLVESSVASDIAPYLNAYRQFRIDFVGDYEIIKSECRVRHPVHRYAGTFDRLARFLGKVALIDLKTGTLQDWTRLQLAGYQMAWETEGGEKIERRYGLELRRNGTYKMEPFDNGRDRADWLAVTRVAKLRPAV